MPSTCPASSACTRPSPSDSNPLPRPSTPTSPRTLLASGTVRWVGEPIAAVVAETYEQATDAAQAIYADIDPLPTLIDLEEALGSETHIYPDAGGNAIFHSSCDGAPRDHRARVLRRLRGRGHRDRHEPTRRTVPTRAAGRGCRLARRPPARMGVVPARSGRPGPDRADRRRRDVRGPGDDTRRRRWLRRQDRLLLRGVDPRRPRTGGRATGRSSKRPAASR